MDTLLKTPLNDIAITDAFWNRYIQLIREEMIPFQWNVLNDNEDIVIDKERNDASIPSEKSHVIENFKIAAGLKDGHHYGWLFQDSDLYKWLEAVANSLTIEEDKQLKKIADEVIDLLEEAQDEDGYLSTYYQIEAPDLKFRRLFESHELYCAGHLIEAGIAYYQATGEEKLLTIACRFADCINDHFGPEDEKIHGADGHQEIELALVKLYEITGNATYLELSQYLLLIRGQDPDFYTRQLEENKEKQLSSETIGPINLNYHQAHKPVTEQDTAEGHAVRLVYMAAAMADVAYHTGNKKMFRACENIWSNIIEKRMFVTGGIGSTVHGEAFTFDYHLPNDTMYCETCASIGLMYFAYNMLKIEVDGSYANVIERCLYNTVISGMALDGKHFFYVNPLEVDPIASKLDPGKSHVKPTRPSWFGCACCPPNIARTLTSINKYIYTKKEDSILVNLFISNKAVLDNNGHAVMIEQVADYLEKGEVKIIVTNEGNQCLNIGIRIPDWTNKWSIKISGKVVQPVVKNEYAFISCTKDSEELTIQFDMPILQLAANPLVKSDRGKVAIQRGPFVYCLEEEDNGKNLHLIQLKEKMHVKVINDPLLGEIQIIESEGQQATIGNKWKNKLYLPYEKETVRPKIATFIPYYSWGNRSLGEMAVWIGKKE